MTYILVENIIVKERIRTRKDDKIPELANSIERLGLMHPIVVDYHTNELVAGERRLKAIKHLGWDKIDATFLEDLNDERRLEIEIEENTQRENLDWPEVVAARAKLHALKVSLYGGVGIDGNREGWQQADTAMSLGLTPAQVSYDLTLAKALESHPELAKIPSKEKAIKLLKTVAERQIIKEIARREQKRIEEEGSDDIQLFNMNCFELMAGLPDNCLDLAIVDPPFGIGKDLLTSGADAKECDFSNDPAECIGLYTSLAPELFRLLKPGTHCYLFFAVQFYQTIRDIYENQGFDLRRMPLVWVKESGRMTAIDWKFMPKYEVLFFMAKPPGRPLNRPTPDAFVINREATIHRIHPMERPRALIKEFLEISSFPGELVLDPFAGSFVTPHMCKEMGRRCIATDMNEDYYNGGLTRLKSVKKLAPLSIK